MAVLLTSSRTYPSPPAQAFEVLLPLPLPDLFRHWYGPLPPIRATDETMAWGSVGQRRHIDLVGPGSMEETLTEVVGPTYFTYRLSDIRGPMAALIDSVGGRWELEPAGTGVRVTWRWNVMPTAVGRPLMPAFAGLWRGYAARALDVLESHLVAS